MRFKYAILILTGRYEKISLVERSSKVIMDKNAIIKNGVYDIFLKMKQELYINGLDSNNKNNYLEIFDEETIINCFKIFNANRARKQYGLNEMIKWCFSIEKTNHFKDYIIIFGTLTFNDKILETTSKLTRRRYVSRFLKDKCVSYIANIDFGNKNNREHYHFVALCKDKIDTNLWKYGYASFTKINATRDIKKIKNYILKLNNHSYKSSTRNERILMNKTKNGFDMIELVIEANSQEYHKYKLLFLM